MISYVKRVSRFGGDNDVFVLVTKVTVSSGSEVVHEVHESEEFTSVEDLLKSLWGLTPSQCVSYDVFYHEETPSIAEDWEKPLIIDLKSIDLDKFK